MSNDVVNFADYVAAEQAIHQKDIKKNYNNY
jgi:hypothetical protein